MIIVSIILKCFIRSSVTIYFSHHTVQVQWKYNSSLQKVYFAWVKLVMSLSSFFHPNVVPVFSSSLYISGFLCGICFVIVCSSSSFIALGRLCSMILAFLGLSSLTFLWNMLIILYVICNYTSQIHWCVENFLVRLLRKLPMSFVFKFLIPLFQVITKR